MDINELAEEGRNFLDNGKAREALEVFMELNDKSPENADVLQKIGHCFKMLEDDESAAAYYEKSLALDPDNFETLFNCGECYLYTGRYEDSITVFEQVAEMAKQKGGDVGVIARQRIADANSHISNREGGDYMKLGKLQEALGCFQRAVEYNPLDKRNYANIGVIFLKQNNLDSAVQWMQKALDVDPEYVRGYYNLGSIYLNMGLLKNAIDLFEKAIEIEPDGRDSADIKNNLGVARERLDEFNKELFDILIGKIIPVSAERVSQLVGGITGRKIISTDIIIINSGKYKFNSFTEGGLISIEEKDGSISIKE